MALGENIKKESILPSSKKASKTNNSSKQSSNGSDIKHELDARISALDEAALVSETDTFGTITHVNSKFCEVAKYSADELIGQPHNIIRHPDSPKSLFKKMWDILKAGKVFHGEIKNKAKDGSHYWVDATIAPVLDDSGKPIKYVAVRFDITDRKRLEEENEQKLEELSRKEEEFSQILHAVGQSNGVVELSLDGTLLAANKKFLDPLGYTEKEIAGKHHNILVEDSYAKSKEYKAFWAKLNRGEFDRGTYKRIGKDGQTVWYDATYNPIRDNKGNLIKVVKYASDVTERRLRNSDNRGRLAAISQSFGVVELGLDGILLAANEHFLKPLGYSEEEIKGKHHNTLVEKSFAESNAYKAFWQKLNKGEFDQGTYRRVGKDGQVVWYDATYNPIYDDEGTLLKVVKYAQDVTSRRLANSENRGKLSAISQSYGTIEYQLDGTILNANDAFQKIIGYSESELKGNNHSILCDKEYIESNEYNALWAKMSHGDVDGGIYKMLTKNNQIVWLQASYTPIIDLDGKPFKVVQYATDLTEQIELQLESDKLKGELESRVSALNASALMSETDLYGTITFVNEKFCEVAGFTEQELIGQPHNIIRWPSNPKSIYKELWDSVQNGRIFQKVYRNKKKDGSHYWVDATIAPVLGADGKPVRYIGLRFDVTEQIDKQQEVEGLMEGVGQSNTMIEYSLEGKIISANKMALESLGYQEEELVGKNHTVLLENGLRNKDFDKLWEKLATGKFDKNTYKRFSKSGEVIWLEGTYNPIFDVDGKIEKIVQYGQNVTARRLRNSENRGKLAAIDRASTVLELSLDGLIINANENFLKPLGYELGDVMGDHHSIFISNELKNSSEYKQFWNALKNNQFSQDTYRMIGKEGQVAWYDATYNPITDDEGNLVKVVMYGSNVTERRLRNSENRGKLAAISQSYGTIEYQLDGSIISVNKSFQDIIGYAEEELTGLNHSLLCDKEFTESNDYNALWSKMKLGEVDGGVYKMITKNNQVIWLQASFTPIIDLDGKPFKVVQYATDITEQIELQLESNKLKGELESRVSALNASALMSETDLYGTITFVNDKFCEVAGFTEQELIGKPHNIIRWPSNPKSIYKELWDSVQNGRIFQKVYRNKKKDGSHYWVDATIAPVIGADGKPVRYIGLRFDVTEQIDKQQEVQGLMEGVGQSNAMIEYSMDGKVLSANDLALESLGYNENEIIGKHHTILLENGVANTDYNTLWDKLRNGKFDKNTYKRFSKSGDIVWLEGTYNPIFDVDGNIEKIVQYGQNVTERRLRNSENRGKLAAINESYGAIEFSTDGTIITANKNYLSTLGYSLEELQGKNHKAICPPEYARSVEHRQLWEKLNRGENETGEFKRIGKNGKEVWLQASYNPIKDDEGNLIKIAQYAQDVTEFKVAFNALSEFLAELRRGNFQAELDLQNLELSGDIAEMIGNNQEMRDTIQSIVSEVNNVVQIAGNEGRLSARLQITDAEGSWKELVDAINELLQSIYEPLQGVNETVTALSEGDLTKRFESKAAGDIKQMGDSLNSAVDNLQTLLLDIERESNVVDTAAEQMLDKSEGMETNTQIVVTEIQSINEGMIEQVARTDESSRFVEGIMRTSESTGNQANVINTSAEKGVQDSQSGMSIVKKLVENMNEIADSANSTSSSIHILTERSEEISRTLNVITDIASQTNLLALNAAIEAARAGDAGRGFAVVAEEIRKLAEDSRKSAVGIERVIQDVQKDVSLATKAIDKMEGSVKNGNTATQEASDVFQTILTSNQETLSISKEVVRATKEQQDSIASVLKNIEKIVVVSEETAAGTKNVSKSADDLSDSMSDITNTSKNLAEVATKLKEGVAKFKLKKN